MTKDPKKLMAARLAMVVLAGGYFLIGAFARKSSLAAMDSYRWSAHTNQVLLEIEGLQATANKVEALLQAGASGASPAQIDDLQETRAREFEYVARLQELTQDNPVQQQRFPALRRALVAETAGLKPDKVPMSVVAARDTQAGLQQRAVSEILQAMTAEERRLLGEREARALAAERISNQAVIGLLLVCGVLLIGAFFLLYRDNRQRLAAERRADDASRKREEWVGELQEQNRKINLLNEFGTSLRLCASPDEVFAVVAAVLAEACSHQGGAIGLTTESRNLVDVVKRWGEVRIQDYFAPGDCCALRGNSTHLVETDKPGLTCHHAPASGINYVCIPLGAQGESIGILHLQMTDSQTAGVHLALQNILPSVSSATAMALANLRLREILRNQSIRDPLTGLYNRRYLEESFDRELRRAVRHQHRLSVLMLDVDHFKAFNDRYGHDAGDAVLRTLAEVMQQIFRGEDMVCRYGGEEFAVILSDTGGESALPIAAKLSERVQRISIRAGGQELPPITISGGLAEFPTDGTSPDQLLRAADERLYEAKHTGRNRILTPAGLIDGALLGQHSDAD